MLKMLLVEQRQGTKEEFEMAANTAPVYALKGFVGQAVLLVGNTNLNVTGQLYDLASGAADGTRIDKLVVQAVSTTSAGMVRFFIYEPVADKHTLIAEVRVDAVTPSASVKAFAQTLDLLPNGIMLPQNVVLRASTHNSETFHVTAFGGLYS
jgi:hypothetical protein